MCHCVCGCQNTLTITDLTDICAQCWRGAHFKPKPDPEDKEARDYIMNVLHGKLCGKVPGFPGSDLFHRHGDVADAIITILKENHS